MQVLEAAITGLQLGAKLSSRSMLFMMIIIFPQAESITFYGKIDANIDE